MTVYRVGLEVGGTSQVKLLFEAILLVFVSHNT